MLVGIQLAPLMFLSVFCISERLKLRPYAGIFHTDVMEVITGDVPPSKPAGGAILASGHLLGQEGRSD